MGQIFIAALKEETPNLKDFHYSGVWERLMLQSKLWN